MPLAPAATSNGHRPKVHQATLMQQTPCFPPPPPPAQPMRTCYLVGPLTMGGRLTPGDDELEDNIETAELVACALVALGYAVIYTHSLARHPLAHRVPVANWVEGGMALVQRGDAVAIIAGSEFSSGCRAELGAYSAGNIVKTPAGEDRWTLSDALQVLEALPPLANELPWREGQDCLREFRRADLLPALVSAARVLTHGRDKHGTDSAHWKAQSREEITGHAIAHLRSSGSDEDESGEPHAAHAAVRALMLCAQ